MLTSALSFGGGYKWAEATLPTADGVWGQWFRDAYIWATTALHLDYTTANRVLITNSGKNVTTDSDLTFVGGDTLQVTNVSATDVYTSSLYVNGEKYYPESEASYVVWVDGGTYYAKEGHTGVVTSSANCATLVNGIIVYLSGTNSGTIFFKEGVYHLTTSIILKPYVNIQGISSVGHTGTRFWTDFNGYAFIDGSVGLTTYNISLNDLVVIGDTTTYPANGGIFLSDVHLLNINNVRVLFPGTHGFLFNGTLNSNIYMKDCYVGPNIGDAANCYQIEGTTHITLDNCISDNGVQSVHIDTSSYVDLINCHFENASGIGISAANGNNLDIINTKVIITGAEGIKTLVTYTKVSIMECTLLSTIGHGIDIRGNYGIIDTCTITETTSVEAIFLTGANNCKISNNNIIGIDGAGGRGIYMDAGAGHIITGNTFYKGEYSIESYCTNLIISHNVFDHGITGTYIGAKITDNGGYNPLGNIANPYSVAAGYLTDGGAAQAFPTTAVNYTVTASPKLVTIYGGTITSVNIDGVPTGQAGAATFAAYRLEPGQIINVVWTVQPSSVVYAC
jgi:hypothetical protein